MLLATRCWGAVLSSSLGLCLLPFLGNEFNIRHWVGMVIVIFGLAVVGYGDYNYFYLHSVAGLSWYTVLAGDLLIVLAQIITAIQVNFEEKILRRHKIQPLQGVGWEGIFGFSTLAILLVPMYFIPWHLPQSSSSWQERKSFEDTIDAFSQWGYSPQVLVPSLILVFNVALYNFASLTVTNEKNATTTVVLDNVRSIIIWAISLGVGWQQFEPFQPVGFIIIFVGICIYYDTIPTIMKHIHNFIMKCTAATAI